MQNTPVKTQPRSYQILCMGDSQTMAFDKCIQAKEYWASRLQIRLRAAGYAVDTINLGISGNTTTQMEARFVGRMARFNPDIVIIYGGVNDGGVGATTQAKIQAMIDESFANSVQPQAVFVMDTNYLNFAAGGDTPTIPYAAYATLRSFQLAAATYGINTYGGTKVFYAGLYAYQLSLINSGIWTQGNDTQTQIAVSDQHMNARAHDDTARFLTTLLQGANGGNLLAPCKIA